MPTHASLILDDRSDEFVSRQVASGRFGSASDVVRAALRLLEEEEAHLADLRAALLEGEQSGPTQPFDFDAFVEAKRAKVGIP